MRNYIKCKQSNKDSNISKWIKRLKNRTKHCWQKRTLKYTESEIETQKGGKITLYKQQPMKACIDFNFWGRL